jgi:hypothetical protein
MSTSTKKAKKKATEKRERKERRFTAEATYASRLAIVAGMAGSLALGAGVYGQWVRDEPLNYAGYLVAAGAIVLGGALYRTGADLGALRVGEAGIGLEKNNEVSRVLWCDVERITLDGTKISVHSKQTNIAIPRSAFPQAIPVLLAEAGRRVPDVVKLSRTEIEAAGAVSEGAGERVTIEEIQVTGRHCKASGKPISFERDARLCPNCCEVYLKDQVPKKCMTCDRELGSRAQVA